MHWERSGHTRHTAPSNWKACNRFVIRDVTFDEDRSQVRTAAAPQVMAALRNLTTTLVRWAGHTNVAAALRRHAARSPNPFPW